mmetsp:Transcript_24411/g.56489  ORF Transcript_24411/g.56489 Transcript_24411/m.56489 type:complete len:187 (+) Transcript_24411:59-619(+)
MPGLAIRTSCSMCSAECGGSKDSSRFSGCSHVVCTGCGTGLDACPKCNDETSGAPEPFVALQAPVTIIRRTQSYPASARHKVDCKSGKLWKINRFGLVQERWCSVQDGIFTVRHSPDDTPTHVVRVASASCTVQSGKKGALTFKVRPNCGEEKRFVLEMRADNVSDMTAWVTLLSPTSPASDPAVG